MKLRDLSELAARNLREAALRNVLTTLGIAVGVASLVAMLSLGVGLQELVGRRLERSGLFDSVLVRPRTGNGGPGQARDRFLGNGPAPAPPRSRLRSTKRRASSSRNCPMLSRSIPNFVLPATCALARRAISLKSRVCPLPPQETTPSRACKGISFPRPAHTKSSCNSTWHATSPICSSCSPPLSLARK